MQTITRRKTGILSSKWRRKRHQCGAAPVSLSAGGSAGGLVTGSGSIVTVVGVNITVRSASKSDVLAVAAVLGEAFAMDPSAHRILGDRDPQESKVELAGLIETIIRHHYLDSGKVDVAENERGEIVGAALWDRPGSSMGVKAKVAVAPQVVRLMGRRLARKMTQGLRASGYHPKFPHWYLYMVGATPESQGSGVGTALLEHGLGRVGDDAAYLEASTPASAKLYERMGFVPMGVNPIPTPGRDPELATWRPGAMPEQS